MDHSVRLNKYISESGICSRREADKYIESGTVFINGRKASIGAKVFPGDRVVVNGQALQTKKADDLVFIAFNKPVGITSTTEAGTKDNIVDYVNHSTRIFPIGRLDKDSQGLIFLTNDGDIVNKILRAGNKHEKEYLVTVNKPITDAFIEGMANGVPMLGVTTKKCTVTKETPFIFRIILIQGLNRQIRRMCEHFGYEVTKLERVRIMNVKIKGLPLGEWRDLTDEEKTTIFSMIEHSSSTAARSKSKPVKKVKNTNTGWVEMEPKPARKKPSAKKSSGRSSDERSFGASGRPGSFKPKNKGGNSSSGRSSGKSSRPAGKLSGRPAKGKSGTRGKGRA